MNSTEEINRMEEMKMRAELKRNGFSEMKSGNFTKLHLHYPDTTTFYAIFQDDGSVYHKEVIEYETRKTTVRNEFTAHTLEQLIWKLKNME